MHALIQRIRIYIQETSEPLHSVWYSFHDRVGQVKVRCQKAYDQIYHPDILYKYSVIGTVAGGSWLLHPLVFPKPGRIRRFLTPMLLGTITAAYLYPNKTRDVGRSMYESGVKKYEEVKDKFTRKA